MPVITIEGSELVTEDVRDTEEILVSVGYRKRKQKSENQTQNLEPVVHKVVTVRRNGTDIPFNPDQVREHVENWIKYNEQEFRKRINKSLRSENSTNMIGWKAGESGGSDSPFFTREEQR